MNKMRYCKNCGWKMEYIPRSFQDSIKEIVDGGKKTGYWKCHKCGSIKKGENKKKD